MFSSAARRLGYQVAVWDPDADAPAHGLAHHSFAAPFSDPAALDVFGKTVDAVTFEWENVPASLCERLEQTHRVRPASSVLRVIQDRIEQKTFLQSHRFPVPAFATIASPDQLSEAVRTIGLPAVCKTATTGYDGKGQWIIRQMSEIAQVERALQTAAGSDARWILETWLDFERELSVLVVRGADGDCRVYPVVANRHERGILRMTLAPAAVSSAVAARAADVAQQAVAAFEGVGVFCIELFQMRSGELLINEMAPRPHNSGHYTLDACTVSQFEQQVRAVCGLPLGEVRLLSPAAMVNLIGEEVQKATANSDCRALLSIPGAVLHLYGKRVVRPGRKMGHVTFLAETVQVAEEQATRFMHSLAEISPICASDRARKTAPPAV
jgi:5-(carboxyamino)imidazole ribonucleotide synthase